MALQITITDAGRAEVINADNTGTGPVTITEVGLGTGQYSPDPEQLTLTAETKRLNTIAGQVVSADIIHVTIKDETGDAYTVNEFGLYTDSGTLFAVYSDPVNPIAQKASASALLLAVDITLSTLNAHSLTFGDTSFSNPPASETVVGVVELATQTETNAGTDDQRVVTPKKLKTAVATMVPAASETAQGKIELASTTEARAGTDNSRAMTPARVKQVLGNLQSSITWTGGTLTAADCGKLISCADGNTTLPLLSACPAGTAIYFLNTASSDHIITCQGNDLIAPRGETVASITLKPGGSLMLVKNIGSEFWMAPFGSARDVSDAIGVNQSWQDVSESRAIGVNYTNTTGKPIKVSITATTTTASGSTSGLELIMNNNRIQFTRLSSQSTAISEVSCFISEIVPNGATYRIQLHGSTSITNTIWSELR